METATTIAGVNIHNEAAVLDVARLKWRPSAYAFIFNARGELLVLDNILNGKYDMVGGGIEIWESAEAAVCREALEETGLTIQVDGFVHLSEQFFQTPMNNHWHVLSLFFKASVLSGTLESNEEDEPSVNPHWIDPNGLRKENFTIAGAWDAFCKLRAIY